jgi:hypothetical protein
VIERLFCPSAHRRSPSPPDYRLHLMRQRRAMSSQAFQYYFSYLVLFVAFGHFLLLFLHHRSPPEIQPINKRGASYTAGSKRTRYQTPKRNEWPKYVFEIQKSRPQSLRLLRTPGTDATKCCTKESCGSSSC